MGESAVHEDMKEYIKAMKKSSEQSNNQSNVAAE
jgi:hypothetical protein